MVDKLSQDKSWDNLFPTKRPPYCYKYLLVQINIIYLLENLISHVDVHPISQKYQIVTLLGGKRINYKIKLKMID